MWRKIHKRRERGRHGERRGKRLSDIYEGTREKEKRERQTDA